MLGNGCRGNVSEPCRLCFCSGAPPILQVTGDLAGTQSSTNSAMLCARNPVPCADLRTLAATSDPDIHDPTAATQLGGPSGPLADRGGWFSPDGLVWTFN